MQLVFYVVGLPTLFTLIAAVYFDVPYYQAAAVVAMHFAALSVYAILMASYNILRTLTHLIGDQNETSTDIDDDNL